MNRQDIEYTLKHLIVAKNKGEISKRDYQALRSVLGFSLDVLDGEEGLLFNEFRRHLDFLKGLKYEVQWFPGSIHNAENYRSAIIHNIRLIFNSLTFDQMTGGYLNTDDILNEYASGTRGGKRIMTGYPPGSGISWA